MNLDLLLLLKVLSEGLKVCMCSHACAYVYMCMHVLTFPFPFLSSSVSTHGSEVFRIFMNHDLTFYLQNIEKRI
jgi:hypothetical protein